MEITLNGEKREAPDQVSLAELIKSLRLEGPVAAMVNGDIVHREKLEGFCLKPGDEVELLRMMGGG